MIVTAIFPVIYTVLMQYHQERSFEAAAPFTFNLKNCEIIFDRDDKHDPTTPQFLIEVPGKCDSYQSL